MKMLRNFLLAAALTLSASTAQAQVIPGPAISIFPSSAAGVTSLAGTANQITASASTGAVTLSTPSDFRLPGTINLLTLTQPAAGATLTLANNSSLITSGAFATTITSTATTNSTLPAGTDTLAGLGTAQSFSAANIFSVAGAASTPAVKLTGTWFTGGSATTTKPQLLIEPAGTTTTGWNTSGTGFGINAASGFVGNIFDIKLNNTTILKLNVASTNDLSFINGNWLFDGSSLQVRDNPATTTYMKLVPNDGFHLGNAQVTAWSSTTNAGGTADTTLCRQAPGILQIGASTGCAATGSILLSAVTLSGATQTLSNAAFANCTSLNTVSNVIGCTVSDRTKKENFRPLSGDLGLLFQNISPQLYNFKKNTPWYDGGRARFGLIAQDVQKYLPQAVFPIGKGQPLQIDHAAIDAAMFAEIKKLRVRLTALEHRRK